jgi:hypothetical protein
VSTQLQLTNISISSVGSGGGGDGGGGGVGIEMYTREKMTCVFAGTSCHHSLRL